MDHSQKPDDLPKQLVENVAAGGDGSAFKEQISSMSNAERLKLVQDLNSSVLDANIANPGNRIILDVRLDNKDGNVKDIDLVRQAPPNSDGQKLNRIDLYDSGDAAGKDADPLPLAPQVQSIVDTGSGFGTASDLGTIVNRTWGWACQKATSCLARKPSSRFTGTVILISPRG